MVDGKGFDVEGRKSICAERWGVKSRNNLVIS